ncbi:MAG: HlyD family efflux transporter periplasmic adaptor subunit [Chitinophagales bacterium]|nr:HlyD family efflux transporter periplasmic adaptor subunit [Chitinophagales bacterium]MDW8272994.1 HlyD family efflux transporter periplasmic adaptor subunit [Chitinophagales bacterium]
MWVHKDTDDTIAAKRQFKSFQKSFRPTNEKKRQTVLRNVFIVAFLTLFLPWTQNIRAPGKVTTLRPQQRPQELNSIIAGRIEKWYVREGDMVKAGDTIIKITEIKEEYLDPELIARTGEQLAAKEATVENYRSKAIAIDQQLKALYDARDFKLSQIRLKIQQAEFYVQSDSMALLAAINDLNIAQAQFTRQKELYEAGLKSLTELEQRNQALQNAQARKVAAENKFLASKNELMNARIELNTTEREYSEKISKAMSEKFAALSNVASGEGDIAKLRNLYKNYSIRSGFYYITAPQSGQITKTIKAGIGEIVKEGEMLVQITPKDFEYAVEMYVSPMDLPLIHVGEKVRFQFDGFPAIVFSGWPNASVGTFGGIIVAVDNNISENGKFRVLVAQDPNDTPWPKSLRLGGGAVGFALLNTVFLGYELWRQFNGFPPDFYEPSSAKNSKDKKG